MARTPRINPNPDLTALLQHLDCQEGRVEERRGEGESESHLLVNSKEAVSRFRALYLAAKHFSSPEMSSETSATSEVKYRKTEGDRPRQFTHWVRPRSALYSYLYDYHRNYYDDVLDYLDRRRRGIVRDIPRPQTWAERALRTYTQKTAEHAIKARNDLDLIHKVHSSRVLHDYHSRDYNAKRFTMYLF